MSSDPKSKIQNNLKCARDFFEHGAQLYSSKFKQHFKSDVGKPFSLISSNLIFDFMCYVLGFKHLQKEMGGPEIVSSLMRIIQKYKAGRKQLLLSQQTMKELILHVIEVEDRIHINYTPPAEPDPQTNYQQAAIVEHSTELKQQLPMVIQEQITIFQQEQHSIPEQHSIIKQQVRQKTGQRDNQLIKTLLQTIQSYRLMLNQITQPRQKSIWQAIIEQLSAKKRQLQSEASPNEDPAQVQKLVNSRLQHIFYQLLKKKYVATDNSSFEKIQMRLKFMNVARFLQFCNDFKVFSTKVTKEQANVLFKRHSSDKLLDFAQFIVILQQFSKTSPREEYKSENYVSFMRGLGLVDLASYQALLKEQGLQAPLRKQSQRARTPRDLVRSGMSKQKVRRQWSRSRQGLSTDQRQRSKVKDQARRSDSKVIRHKIHTQDASRLNDSKASILKKIDRSVHLPLLDQEEDDLLAKFINRQASSSVAEKVQRRALEQRQKEESAARKSRRYN